jgi:hypothetical protein
MDVLREQIQKLRPEEQERVFALLVNDDVPFHRSNDSVMMMLSKASENCISNIQSYLRDLQATSTATLSRRAVNAQPGTQIVREPALGVHFDREVAPDESDGESPERKLTFSSAQAAVRKRIKLTQKRNVRLRKSSSKRDYGERLEVVTEGNALDGEELPRAQDDNDEEAEPASEVPDVTDFDGDIDDTACGPDADEVKSVDGTFEEDDISAVDDDDNQAVDDIKEPAAHRNSRLFNYGNSTVDERFTHYVSILSRYGYDFGDLAANGYPHPAGYKGAESED